MKDKTMTEVCKAILLVPHSKQHKILEVYLKQCIRLHSIAMLQWRLRYEKGDPNQINELISKCKNEFTIYYLRKSVDIKLPCNFYQKYHYLLKSTGSYLVEDLDQLGMKDAFTCCSERKGKKVSKGLHHNNETVYP